MATQNGIIKFRGKLAGFTFYQRRGDYFVRSLNPVTKEQIATDPRFEGSRNSSREFSGASMAGKQLRVALNKWKNPMFDPVTSSRLLKPFREIIKRSQGDPGKRPIDIASHGHVLKNFNFREKTSFTSVFTPKVSVETNPSRTTVTLTIPSFHSGELINPPYGASHFKLIAVTVPFTNLHCIQGTNSYEPMQDFALHCNPSEEESDHIQLGTTTSLTLQTPVPTQTPPSPSTALIVCLAIQFFQKNDQTFYPMTSDSCMTILEVF